MGALSLYSLKCAQHKAAHATWIINDTILHILLKPTFIEPFRLFARRLQWNNHNGIFPGSSLWETDTNEPEWTKVREKKKGR